MKTATIVYDETVVTEWELDAEARSIAYMLRKGLLGQEYPPGRGIKRIEVLTVLPSTRAKIGM